MEFELRREIRRLQEYRKAGIKSFCSESRLTFSLLCSTKLNFKLASLSRENVFIFRLELCCSLYFELQIVLITICSSSTVYQVYASFFGIMMFGEFVGTQRKAQLNILLSCYNSCSWNNIRGKLAELMKDLNIPFT